MNEAPVIVRRVVGTIGVTAVALNVGILGLCAWFVGTKQDIPNLLLGALIANSGQALGALNSVLNSTRPNDVPADVNVVNTTADPVPVADAD